jgi:hypothetical protein
MILPFLAPIAAAGIGAAGSFFGAKKAADSTASAAAAQAEAAIKTAKLAGKFSLERQQQLFDLQREGKEEDIFRFDPMERYLTASFAASPLAQKLTRQQFYNQKALDSSFNDRLSTFTALPRFYGV